MHDTFKTYVYGAASLLNNPAFSFCIMKHDKNSGRMERDAFEQRKIEERGAKK